MARTAYWIVVAAADYTGTPPSGLQVRNGQQSNGSSAGVTAGSEPFTATSGTGTITEATAITLSAGTAYKVAWTIWDDVADTYATVTVGDYTTAIAVPAGALSLTGHVPTVLANVSVSVPAGTLTLAAYAPAVTAPVSVAAPVGALAITGHAPAVSVSANVSVSVPAGALTLTKHAPSVLANITVSAPAGALTLTGHAPTVEASSGVSVPAAGLTLTGHAPTVIAPVSVLAPAGAVTLTGHAPGVSAPASVSVPVGGITVAGYAPTVAATQNVQIDVPAGALSLTGHAPSVLVNGEPVSSRGGGWPRGVKRRYRVRIEDDEYEVDSIQQVEKLLERVRMESEQKAQVALERAGNARRRPVRKVLADARKTLRPPAVSVEGDQDYARRFVDEIASLYRSTLQTIEIGALLRDTDRRIEEDDEDILLLL